MSFKEVDIKSLNFNPFTKIDKEWMLITAGDEKGFNTMTASWGALGVLWNKYTATAYIRSTRYTKKFVDNNDLFTLSFFDEKYKDALTLCGRVSGRDTDKVKDSGFTPVFSDGTSYFDEANMVFICKKIYHTDIVPENMYDASYDDKIYPLKDYHTMYFAEILKVLVKE